MGEWRALLRHRPVLRRRAIGAAARVALSALDRCETYVVKTNVGRTLDPEPFRSEAKKERIPHGGLRTPRDSASGFRARFDYSRQGSWRSTGIHFSAPACRTSTL